MSDFFNFWNNLSWLANLLGICLAFPIFKFVSKLISWLKTKKDTKNRELRYKTNKKMNNSDYLKWQLSFFKKTYSKSEFVTLYNREYPATIIRSSREIIYPFNDLCHLLSSNVIYFPFDKHQKKYLKFLGGSVKRPKMKGFATDELILDANGKVKNILAKTITYEQNLVTSHILEFELYKYYEKNNKKEINIEKDLKYRTKYHGNKHPSLAILKPSDACPLISVQALIIYKDYKEPENISWKAIIAQRQKNVAVKPDIWQIQPAGGFEIFGDESDDNKILIEQGFDIKNAVLREYAEELYNIEEFSFCNDGRDSNSILTENHVSTVLNLISKNKASFEFLGIITDLSVLRHEASFLIVIDDRDYSLQPIIGSSESIKISSVSMMQLKEIFSNQAVHSSSAGLLQLAIECETLREMGISDLLK
ncbi:hypothetical protein [Tolumonas lignilytica]|uniref:hypothetical protein n=1 Tax=Tolumonas lignilytica TaxID=1283284 RepID=UPI000467A2B2|nr:hypothetical protein [Tolumonas lignilytica]